MYYIFKVRIMTGDIELQRIAICTKREEEKKTIKQWLYGWCACCACYEGERDQKSNSQN